MSPFDVDNTNWSGEKQKTCEKNQVYDPWTHIKKPKIRWHDIQYRHIHKVMHKDKVALCLFNK